MVLCLRQNPGDEDIITKHILSRALAVSRDCSRSAGFIHTARPPTCQGSPMTESMTCEVGGDNIQGVVLKLNYIHPLTSGAHGGLALDTHTHTETRGAHVIYVGIPHPHKHHIHNRTTILIPTQ